MGHLINPTGFRLSVLHNWKDNWMSSNFISYTELLHNTHTIKEVVRDYLRVSTKITPIIYSHYNIEQLFSQKMSLRVYYYDSDIEFKYRDLRYACKRIYFNHKRLYKSFFKMHRHFLPEARILSKHEKVQFFYASLIRRGFFEYLLLRKLILLFLCAMARDDSFRKNPSLLLQIKLGVFSLLEYNWRKNLFLGKPLNFFEFFLGVFLQMQFLEKNSSINSARAGLFYFQNKKTFANYNKYNIMRTKSKSTSPSKHQSIGKYIELSFLSKWFKFSRLNLIQNLLSDRKKLLSFVQKTEQSFFLKKNMKTGLNYFNKLEVAAKTTAFLNSRADLHLVSGTGVVLQKYKKVVTGSDYGLNKIKHKTTIRYDSTLIYDNIALGYLTKMGALFYWMSDTDLGRISKSHSKFSLHLKTKIYKMLGGNTFKLRLVDAFLERTLSTPEFKNKKIISFEDNEQQPEMLENTLIDANNWSLFIYSYMKYSHNLWQNSSQLLSRFLQSRFMAYYNLYNTLSKHWTSMSIWAVNLFLDFYRIFLARTYYIYRFGFSKLNIEYKLNKVSILPVEIEFFGFDNDWVTAPFVAFYLARKFEQDFTIKELFKPICRDLKRIATRTPYLLGYKLQFVGRLTRRDRLRTSWVLGGRVPLSTISANVEYGNDFGILRNGVCSVKVWLYRPKFVGDPSWTYLYKIVF